MSIFNVVKQKLSILDVVSEYSTLKKIGLYYKGNCPFHHERTASFTVSPHKEIFYCFGCHSGGDVVSFIAKVENCTQIEAAKLLIERYQIELPENFKHEKFESTQEAKKKYAALCTLVAEWTQKHLLQSKQPLDYLLKRNITLATIKNFNVGFFPSGSSEVKQLLTFAQKHSFIAQDFIEARILLEGRTGLYSSFEDRILFPIKDHLGLIIGFGGRIYKAHDERAKYYNSHDHPFFNKGTLLFGLDSAKKKIQELDYAFLVEGYMDVITMVQHGFTNTIATLGTACTQEHLKQLARYTSRVYITYDSDTAGQKAILRLLELCWNVNIDLYVITLPEKHDPASYLASGNDFESHIQTAQDIFSFFIKITSENFYKKGLQEKIAATKHLIEVISHIKDPLKQDLLLQQAATSFEISFETLKNQIKKAPVQETVIHLEKETPDLNIEKVTQLEKKLFSAILYSKNALSTDDIKLLQAWLPEPLNKLFTKVTENNIQASTSFECFTDEEKQLVSKLIIEGEEDNEIENLLLQFYKKQWKIIVHSVKLRIKQAQAEQDTIKINKMLVNLERLKKKMLARGVVHE